MHHTTIPFKYPRPIVPYTYIFFCSFQVVCVSLHPGTVNTDLSRPYHRNVPKDKLFDTERSVNYLMSIVDTLNIEKTGKAYNWDGTELPW